MKEEKIYNKKLYKAILNRGLTIKEAAIIAGISYETLRKMINGETRNPGILIVRRLEAILNVDNFY